jgi:ribosomal protein L2
MSYKELESLIKSYKPVTPSLRHRIVLKGEKIGNRLSKIDNTIKFNKRKLIKGTVNKRGRNNLGRITCYTKGGGNKRKRRQIDHNRIVGEYSRAEVISIENNPYSTASIALLKIIKSNNSINLKEINAPKIPSYIYFKNLKTQQQITK